MPLELFSPYGSNTVAVSVSGTHAEGTLSFPGSTSDLSSSSGTRSFNIAGTSVRIYNSTAVIVFIQFGTSATAATTSHMPIPPGATEMFQLGPSVTTISAITSGGTGTLYATTGMGA